MLDSVLVGAARWQLRQQGRREKQDTDEARLCECGALPSGLEHRWLECPLFQEVRDAHPDAVSLLRTLPLITQRYGLFIQGVEEKILRATADMRPLPSRQDLGILAHEAVAFVDGSAHLPQERRFRQAGYAVVVRNQLVSDDALTISGKPSGAQTVPRAELSAGLQGVRSGKNVTVYSDCQHFVDSWDQFRELPYELMPNGDLWKLLDEEASRARAEGRTIRVFKVKAHQVLAKIADPHARLLAEGNDAVDKAAKAAAPLCAEWTRLRAEHRRRCAQARCIHKFFVAVQSCAMDKLQEVAPRKSTGVLAPVQQECCLPSWGDVAWAVQAPFPALPDVIPKWCHHAKLGNGLFARFVLLWASLLKWSPGQDDTQVVSWVELAASFEISMGVRIPTRAQERKCHAARELKWAPLDAGFGVETPWGEKADELRTACGQLSKLMGRPLVLGDRTLVNLSTLHGFSAYRIPVSAVSRRPLFPHQSETCNFLHQFLATTAPRVGPHSWRPRWSLHPLQEAQELLRAVARDLA